jgi:hypothetical protein
VAYIKAGSSKFLKNVGIYQSTYWDTPKLLKISEALKVRVCYADIFESFVISFIIYTSIIWLATVCSNT